MRRALGWLCYRIVMAWPGAWPIGAVAGWILAWADDYAYTHARKTAEKWNAEA